MSFAARHNRGTRFDISIEGYTYKKPSEMVEESGLEKVYQIAGLFINTKGKFGEHPVAIVPDEKALVDLPAHMTDDVRAILESEEDCDAIRDGLVGIRFEIYKSKTYNRDCVGVRWIDL